MPRHISLWSFSLALVFAAHTLAAETPTTQLLETIKKVSREGQGHVAASAAVKELSAADAAVLPDILHAFRDANPLAANWLRGAFDAIAERTVKAGDSLPVEELKAFIGALEENPRARRLAFEWVKAVDAASAEKLVPGLLLDPSAELRREAVDRLIREASELEKAGEKEKAVAAYQEALRGAVEDDQVKEIVKPLKALNVEVNLQEHFGFLSSWQIIGPFDNRGGIGFAAVYPPEKEIDLQAKYEGQLGEVAWQPIQTTQDYGIVDIGKDLQNYKGSVMYAYAEFHSDGPREVEVRLGTPNAWKLWVNGRFEFGREEYHRGMALDQYRVPVSLKPGRNVILFKICQNEQDQDWAQRYQFQMRVSDGAGSAVRPSHLKSTSQLERR